VDRPFITVSGAQGSALTESGIPTYPRAENIVSVTPTAAELRAMLGKRDLAAIRGLRAIVFRVPAPVSAAEIMRWYATQQGPAARPAGAAAAEAVAGPRGAAVGSQTGIRPLASDPGYLVVSVTPAGGQSQDLQVTVARVEGSPGIVKLLDEVAAIVGRGVVGARLSGRNADVAAFAPPGGWVERDISLPGTDVPKLLQQIAAADVPAAVRRMYAAIRGSARSIRLTTYLCQGPVSPEAFFNYYRQAAGRQAWGEVMHDPEDPERPMLVFTLGEGRGVVMIRGEVTPVLIFTGRGLPARSAKGMRITLLVVEGPVDLKAIREAQP